MTRKLSWVLVLLAVAPMIASGQKGGGTSQIPVTSTIFDTNAAGVPYYIQSDGVGPYVNGQYGVVSVLQPQDWLLDTYDSTLTTSSGRNALITFSSANAIQAGNPADTAAANPPFWGTMLEPVRFITKCLYLHISVATILPGNPQYCPMVLRFANATSGAGGTTTAYRFDMVGANLCKACINEPETQYVQISCNAANASGCYDWSIDSIPPTSQSGGVPTNQVVARLNLVATTKSGSTTYVDEGDFYLTFHIHVTNP